MESRIILTGTLASKTRKVRVVGEALIKLLKLKAPKVEGINTL